MQKKKSIGKIIYEYFLVTVGTFGVAASTYYFMFPANLTIGSAAALAMIVSAVTPIPVSVSSFIINGVLLVIGLLVIGRDFGAKTIYSTFIISAFFYLFEIVTPLEGSLTGDALVDMICYTILCCVSQAILFNINASSGGIDIVAKILNKYLGMNLGKGIMIVGMVVAVAGIFLYDLDAVIISILGTYLSGVVLDYYIAGFTVKKKICIISLRPEILQDYIMKKLEKGVTLYSAVGAYDMTVRTEICTILDRNDYVKLMDFIHKNDPGAFVTVSSINEVHGEWDEPKRFFRRKGKE